jgi:hypothetical protein
MPSRTRVIVELTTLYRCTSLPRRGRSRRWRCGCSSGYALVPRSRNVVQAVFSPTFALRTLDVADVPRGMPLVSRQVYHEHQVTRGASGEE